MKGEQPTNATDAARILGFYLTLAVRQRDLNFRVPKTGELFVRYLLCNKRLLYLKPFLATPQEYFQKPFLAK